ncbi:hypothetical protein GE118_03635 [Mycoplasma sp. NEAQ87857]|uniref:hypothetical protein n=1 Tax=Mycoplasma sp. NEAQ87857 TaxID=2683967 RepID=UPI0013193F05|nr:hypothetical protein [Mycoplasma sp. NEAQ87857]QGZ97252.1 hypothetical protein GE118_00340 [Mycoplasma sp. NEAQ87857]QGZ97874.1 hypothetical protein GE118_03635 [Mycoplasma sp. NEAQ87857]
MTLEQLNNLKFSLTDFRVAARNIIDLDYTKEFLKVNERYLDPNNEENSNRINNIIGVIAYTDTVLFNKLFDSISSKWDPRETIKVYKDKQGNEIIVDGNKRALILMLLYKLKKLKFMNDYDWVYDWKNNNLWFEIIEKLKKFSNDSKLIEQVKFEYVNEQDIQSILLENMFPDREKLKLSYNKGIYLFNIFSTFIEKGIKTLEQYKEYEAKIFNPFKKDAKEFFKDYQDACFLYQTFLKTDWIEDEDNGYGWYDDENMLFVLSKDPYQEYNSYKNRFYSFCFSNKVSKFTLNNVNWYFKYGYAGLSLTKNDYKFDDLIKFQFNDDLRQWLNILEDDKQKTMYSLFKFILELDKENLLTTSKKINPDELSNLFFRYVHLPKKEFKLADVIQDIFKFNSDNLKKLHNMVDEQQVEIEDLIWTKIRINDEIEDINKFQNKFQEEKFLHFLLEQNDDLLINNNFLFNVLYSNLRSIIQYIINVIYLDYLKFLITLRNDKPIKVMNKKIILVKNQINEEHLESRIKILNYIYKLNKKVIQNNMLDDVFNKNLVSAITQSFLGKYNKEYTILTQFTITQNFFDMVVVDNPDFNNYVKEKFNLDLMLLLPKLIFATTNVLNKWVHCAFLIANQDKYNDLIEFMEENIKVYKWILYMLSKLNITNFINSSKELFKVVNSFNLINKTKVKSLLN